MRKPHLVAAGDDVADAVPALLEHPLREDHHPAALPDHRDRPGREAGVADFGERGEPAWRAQIPHAVGAGDGEPGLGDDRRERTAAREPVGILRLAEARGEHGGATRPGRGTGAQRVGDARGRNEHDEMIGRLRQVAQIGIAAHAPDLGPPGIERIDRAGKAAALQVAPHALGPASRPVAGADDDDVLRCRERADEAPRGLEPLIHEG